MRKRQGRAASYQEAVEDGVVSEKRESNGEPEKPECEKDARQRESGGDTRERVFSWFDVARAGAQLTLDVMRVIREGTDLYRKLSGGKGGTRA